MTRATVEHIKAARPDAVYIGRGFDPRTGHKLSSKRWGNPFSLAEFPPDEVARRYFRWLRNRPHFVDQVRTELAGKQLACWCHQPGPCHGLVLAALANGKALDEIEKDCRDSGLLARQEELFG